MAFSPFRIFSPSVLISLVTIMVFVLDQWSKYWIISNIYFDEHCSLSCGHKILIPNWLEFAPIPNMHGAFGMFGSNKLLLVALACIVLVIFWWSFREAAARSRLVCVALGMIAGGAIGNIADRLHYGYVIDFVAVYRLPQIWHNTFNVGDFCITFGVALLLISGLFRARDRKKAGHATPTAKVATKLGHN
ncbi:MAG TPA: signal peptidase II [Verrucomicrobiae bacterium]|nr:signal peptidase II [Verrucomicrobiae bacterium]